MKRFHETKEYTFSGLVNNYKRFIIPNFQRSYKWGTKQITDFFSSIEENNENYFIGNIVCVVGDKNEENRLMIVDGQQRITTITLMLIALRDYAKEILINSRHDAEKAVGWISDYLKDRDKKDRKDYVILKARKSTYNDILCDLVNENILNKKYDKAQLVYLRSYKMLKKLISDKVGQSYEKLEDFTNKVLELEVVAIVLNSDEEVFNAFDGLNSKGLGLSTSDQIRNYLFSHADRLECLDEIEQKWNEMESYFEKVNPDLITKFLRHLWIAENKYISGKDLYRVIRNQITSKKNQKTLNVYCDELLEYSRFYLGVRYKSFSHNLDLVDPIIKKTLVQFEFLDNQQVYEILLSLYIKYKSDKKFKPKYFRDISQILWNFCLRTKFLVISPSKYERKFAEYCTLVRYEKSIDILNKSKTFITDLRKLTKDRDQFIESMMNDLTYDSDSSLIEFLLRKVIECNEKNVITLTESSIEHILPQEPKEWGFSKKEIKDYVHSIGNLTLLHPKDNQKAKNKPMKKKCIEIYNKSHFKFNKEISSKYQDIFIDDYKEAIKQRGEDISEQIYLITKI